MMERERTGKRVRQASETKPPPLKGTAKRSFRVTLPLGLNAYVHRCVASGWYMDAKEVLADAVRSLKAKNENLLG